jgi:hypothetical protein
MSEQSSHHFGMNTQGNVRIDMFLKRSEKSIFERGNICVRNVCTCLLNCTFWTKGPPFYERMGQRSY